MAEEECFLASREKKRRRIALETESVDIPILPNIPRQTLALRKFRAIAAPNILLPQCRTPHGLTVEVIAIDPAMNDLPAQPVSGAFFLDYQAGSPIAHTLVHRKVG